MSVAPVRAIEDVPEEEVISLRQLVRERLELSDEPDPHRAINGMVVDLPQDVLVRAAQFGLVEIAKHIARHDRRRHVAAPQGSAKWDVVRAAAQEHRDIFAERVWVGGEIGWKFLADCTKPDLVAATAALQAQADGLLASVGKYERLSKVLKRDQVVSDLDRAKVERIFDA